MANEHELTTNQYPSSGNIKQNQALGALHKTEGNNKLNVIQNFM